MSHLHSESSAEAGFTLDLVDLDGLSISLTKEQQLAILVAENMWNNQIDSAMSCYYSVKNRTGAVRVEVDGKTLSKPAETDAFAAGMRVAIELFGKFPIQLKTSGYEPAIRWHNDQENDTQSKSAQDIR